MSFITLPPGAALRPKILSVSPATALRDVAPSSALATGMDADTAGGAYRWDATSLLADNGTTVLRPNDVAALDPGRWLYVPPPGGGFPEPYEWALGGVYSGVVTPAFFDAPRLVVPPLAPRTLQRVWMLRRTAGTAGNTSVQVYRNGNPVLVVPLSVAAGSGDNAAAQTVAFNVGEDVFNATDIIEAAVVAVETFKAGPPPGPDGLRLILQF